MFTTLFLICFVFVSSYFPSLINATTEEKVEFGYNGYNGPQNWHLLKNSDIICKNGKNQSPINIMPEELKKFAKPPCPTFNDAHYVESHNTGNTVELSSTDMSNTTIKIKGKLYKLQQFHFHTPSEHRINGKYHDVEQHLVFESVDGKGRTSVVSVFYDISLKNSTFMDPIIQNIPVNVDEKKKIEKIELSNLLCDINYITKAYTYSGSLTTPPCTEGVTWYVNTKPLNIGMNQLVHLRHALGFNSRFTQQRFNYPKKKCTTH